MMPERLPLAKLDEAELKVLGDLEEELGVTLVAYESAMHDDVTNHIVESDV